MEDGIEIRVKAKIDEIKDIVNYLEKEFRLVKPSEYIEDNKRPVGYYVFFVTVLPKQVVTQ